VVQNVLEDESLRQQLETCRIPLDHLQLEKVIGQGAYGEVIKGTYHGTPVVLKRMLRSKITEEQMREFADEILLMMQLRHPNVVQFIGATWNTFSNIGFVLELAERGDLADNLHDKGLTLSWSDPLHRVAVDTARGMSYLHSNSVMHRDLKSMNILLSATFGAKVCDFGLAKKQQTLDEQQQTQVGTPLWTAPEVIMGEKYTAKADVFSYGIVLTELLSRKIPYEEHTEGKTAFAIMLKVANDGLRPTIPDWCPTALRALIDSCLEPKEAARPTMPEVLAVLMTPEVVEFHAQKVWLKTRELVQSKVHLSLKEIESAATNAPMSVTAEAKKGKSHKAPSKLLSLDDDSDSDLDDEDAEIEEEW
jgi:serine/threonine protein kinase